MMSLNGFILNAFIYCFIVKELIIQALTQSCTFEDKTYIYIQWISPMSGWYYLDQSGLDDESYSSYIRSPSASNHSDIDLKHYEFYGDGEGKWYLAQWTKNENYKSLIYETEFNNSKSPYGIGLYPRTLPVISNYQKREFVDNDYEFTRSYQDRVAEEIPILSSTIKPKRDSSITRKRIKRAKRENDTMDAEVENNNETSNSSANIIMTTKYEPSFKVYCPKRCKCQTVHVDYPSPRGTQFTRLDLISHQTIEECEHMLAGFPDLHATLKENNLAALNNMSSNTNSSEELDYTPEDDNIWMPTYFVSESCGLLYFEKKYNVWVMDFKWHLIECDPDLKKLSLYITNDVAPCIEYLPRPEHQTWLNPQVVSPKAQPSKDDIHYCEKRFHFVHDKNISAQCSSLEED